MKESPVGREQSHNEHTLSAAEDLYGEGSTEHAAVAAAWSAVSVT